MEIRLYNSGDEQKILELFGLAFGKQMSLEYWQWRFLKNPFTDQIMIALMWDDDKLVGHYAVSPVEILYKYRKYLTALSMTTMTHPEYGGRGIFSSLANFLYDKINKENNVEMVWGFPNNKSHYGFIKNLKWQDISILPLLSIDTKKLLSTDFLYNLIKINNFNKAFSINNDLVQINKNISFLNWRYLQNPSSIYEIFSIIDTIEHTIVCKLFKDNSETQIDFVDFNIDLDSNKLLIFINQILGYYKSKDIEITKINTWCSIHNKYFPVFEKIGFQIGSPVTYFSSMIYDEKNIFFQEYKNWDIKMVNSDIY